MKNPSQKFARSALILFTLSLLFCLRALPQNQHLIDSLKNVITVTKYDTNRVKLFLEIGEQYRNTIPDTALYYYQEALEIAENIEAKELIAKTLIRIGSSRQLYDSRDKAIEYLERALKISEEIGDKEKITSCYVNIGSIIHDQGSYDKAIEYYLKALETAKEINFKKGLSWSYISLGSAYSDQGSYEESIGYYFKALEIQEELGDKRNMSASYNNIGLIHYEQGTYDKSIEYLQKSLSINEELGDKRAMSLSYNNIGNVYNRQGSYDKTIEFYDKALKLFEELGNKRGISGSTLNLGETYLRQGSFDKADEYYLKSLKIYEELGDKWGIAVAGISIANLNISLADSVAVTESQRLKYLNQAVTYGNKAIVNAQEMKLLPTTKEAANALMTAYNKLGNYKRALEFAGILIATQDSLFREDKTRAVQEMSTRYETEKKQQQIELQESQLIAKDARIKQQKTFRNALIGGLVAIALIIVLISMAYRQKRKDNKKILEQNEQILKTNEELKQLNETTSRQKDEIISSINYAQRIQSAILPPETYITELLNENFILYKPKDIVSGDFYWIKQVKHYIILVSADCTGHGVPGAFMSMLGISYLNEIVQRREITQANQVLNELRKEIKHSLRQSGKKEETRDGIDIALCVIDSKKNILQYSGAHNPLYIISNTNGESVFKEIKADPMPVGVHFSSDKPFTNHEIQLEIGDTFYIFSDGFVDQIGGDNNHRFTSEKFKKLLLDIHDEPMYEQKEILDQTLKDWMGEHTQRDDILVIGARI
jgi:serine phosphatase RsbU (regulator of sigma subunit)/Tfp pilus assembly protein PilF